MTSKLNQAKQILNSAPHVLVTASNGFSIGEGINIFQNNDAFQKVLGDLIPKYHFNSILSALSYPYDNLLDAWQVWARLTNYFVGNYHISPQMQSLKQLLKNKDYLIATSNGEYHFNLAGFNDESVLATEGDWGTVQCFGSHDNRQEIKSLPIAEKILAADKENQLTFDSLPKCETCGNILLPHLPFNAKYLKPVQSQEKFSAFLNSTISMHNPLTVLELGVGQNHPNLRKPIFDMLALAPQANYIIINRDHIVIPDSIKKQTIEFSGNIEDVLRDLTAPQNTI
ncbi:hypothetical protein JMJ99_01450 [Companilactobacillus zhachilii]|uniref:hypothetical protein n=1 Tax=Companilactobacillus zhachilii TaxID=2304606 RepID=UPI0019232D9B|nr:hypothetical protein [Companilactobacillus zhachilii]MBL3530016.1 hypothetical protein [Companilactobacillus zhachilii]